MPAPSQQRSFWKTSRTASSGRTWTSPVLPSRKNLCPTPRAAARASWSEHWRDWWRVSRSQIKRPAERGPFWAVRGLCYVKLQKNLKRDFHPKSPSSWAVSGLWWTPFKRVWYASDWINPIARAFHQTKKLACKSFCPSLSRPPLWWLFPLVEILEIEHRPKPVPPSKLSLLKVSFPWCPPP